RVVDNAQRTLLEHGVDPGDVLADGPQPPVGLELTGGGLEPEGEQLLLQLHDLGVELRTAQVAQFGGLRRRHQMSPASRLMKRAFIGSLWIASRSASRATSSGTPATSKSTRPGLTLATHHSGEPLPDPIRVSAGFLVSGRSGKMLIQTLPPRFM